MIRIEASTWPELRERIAEYGFIKEKGVYRCKQGRHVMIFQGAV
jgi:hypothetical protein